MRWNLPSPAPAGAIDELISSGALDDVSSLNAGDDITRELESMSSQSDVEAELARMKGIAPAKSGPAIEAGAGDADLLGGETEAAAKPEEGRA